MVSKYNVTVQYNTYLTKPVQFDDCLKLVEEIQQYWPHISKLPPKNKRVP